MSEAIWYYLKENEQLGPMTEEWLSEALNDGTLKHDTLVWSKSLTQWTPAWRVENFNLPVMPPPPPLSSPLLADAKSVPQVRPWVRYGARMLDIYLFYAIVGIVLGIAGSIIDFDDNFSNYLIFLAWAPVEAVLLTVWGTTPGKSLFSIKLKSVNSDEITFGAAIKRSFLVLISGLGLGIPIVSLIALIRGYYNLKEKGSTFWDEKSNFKVIHEAISVPKILAIIFIFLSFIGLMILGSLDI